MMLGAKNVGPPVDLMCGLQVVANVVVVRDLLNLEDDIE